MTKNNKPVLSILIDKDKRDRFAEFSRRNNLSMGYLVNQAIDRMLETESIDTSPIIYRQSVATTPLVDSQTISMSRSDVENLIKTYVDSLGGGIDSACSKDSKSSVGISIEDVERMINNGVESLAERLNELETYTCSQFAAVRDEFESLSSRVDSATAKPDRTEQKLAAAKSSPDGESEPDNIKTWDKFFKMVEIEAITAVEAQKKDNRTIRNEQIEMGLQAARECGLGEWVVKVAGRSFARVTPHHHGEVIDVTKG